MDPDHSSPSRLPMLLIGLVLGLVIAGILWFLTKNETSNQADNSTQAVLTLNIDAPRENLATQQETLNISGGTGIQSVVTITGPSETKILQTSDNKFSTTVKLVEGKNTIDFVVYDPATGNSKHEVREILYMKEDLSSL